MLESIRFGSWKMKLISTEHNNTEVEVEDRDNNLVIRVNGDVVWSYYPHHENPSGRTKTGDRLTGELIRHD